MAEDEACSSRISSALNSATACHGACATPSFSATAFLMGGRWSTAVILKRPLRSASLRMPQSLPAESAIDIQSSRAKRVPTLPAPLERNDYKTYIRYLL